MLKVVFFILALLMSYTFGLQLARADGPAHWTTRAHNVQRSAQPRTTESTESTESTVFARSERFHTIRQFCITYPDRCVRVGNTYIVQ